MRRSITVSLPAHAAGQLVELFVGTRDGVALLDADEARALATELLQAADRAEGVAVPSLDAAFGKGGG